MAPIHFNNGDADVDYNSVQSNLINNINVTTTTTTTSTNNNNNKLIIYNGNCGIGQCGLEAACINFVNNTYMCICPHDSSQPTVDFKCPNRIIVPPTPQPIHNIIPPNTNNNNIYNNVNSNSNTTIITNKQQQVADDNQINNTNGSTPRTTTTSNLLLNNTTTTTLFMYGSIASIIIIFLLLFYLLFITYNRRRSKTTTSRSSRTSRCRNTSGTSNMNRIQPTPLNLKKSVLMSERYTPNPQYSTAAALTQVQLQQTTTRCAGDATLDATTRILERTQIQFIQEIGEGCFGKVYKGELLLSDAGETLVVAIKVLKERATSETEDDFMREVDIMSTFTHTNILTLVGIVFKDPTLHTSPWMMVFEYMPFGDLAELLRTKCKSSLLYNNNNNNSIEELNTKHLLSAALQIADGMRYLASQRFVHRDLACRNCLVGYNFIVKIADFGMSRDVYTCDYYKIGGSRLLPIRWMSPESVLYGRFTLESDVWSYGVVLWEIFSFGKQPYYGHNNDQVVQLILQNIMLMPPTETDCPTFVCDLMKLCWKSEPRDRIRFSDIYDYLYKYINENNEFNKTTLPRPPAITVTSNINIDLLDDDGYLMPQPSVSMPSELRYVQTLPDSLSE